MNRLFDRYASLAVLVDDDDGWKPNHYGFEVLGCKHHIQFPVVKLSELADQTEALDTHRNPFALITAAHLRTRQTRHDPEARYQAKRTLVRLLYRQGWARQRVLDLFAVLDWMMRLPDSLEQKLWQDIAVVEGESKMRYVTSVERLVFQRGIQQGEQKGEAAIIQRLLAKRFGILNAETLTRLQTATCDQLECWAEILLDAALLDEVFNDN
jgi:hypothetical protein